MQNHFCVKKLEEISKNGYYHLDIKEILRPVV